MLCACYSFILFTLQSFTVCVEVELQANCVPTDALPATLCACFALIAYLKLHGHTQAKALTHAHSDAPRVGIATGDRLQSC